ncbi:hypothetical protein KP509_38G034300 [Ceratopteris richardii]|uniref:Uncharacterized protein n=1 Tax=Ceratopteris richardii TaxID=49495 RepID=A0A8T2Q3R0_CERRI|nr:hypothetical protein KP509_38G034300 [Ceratopteris richardii]
MEDFCMLLQGLTSSFLKLSLTFLISSNIPSLPPRTDSLLCRTKLICGFTRWVCALNSSLFVLSSSSMAQASLLCFPLSPLFLLIVYICQVVEHLRVMWMPFTKSSHV